MLMPNKCALRNCERPIVDGKYCSFHPDGKLKRNGTSWPEGTAHINDQGYVTVRLNDKWHLQHVLVLQFMIRRKLLKHESVHHKNGVRHDNRPENLELWVGGIRYGQRAADIKCAHCGESYAVSNLPYGAARD